MCFGPVAGLSPGAPGGRPRHFLTFLALDKLLKGILGVSVSHGTFCGTPSDDPGQLRNIQKTRFGGGWAENCISAPNIGTFDFRAPVVLCCPACVLAKQTRKTHPEKPIRDKESGTPLSLCPPKREFWPIYNFLADFFIFDLQNFLAFFGECIADEERRWRRRRCSSCTPCPTRTMSF